jgi:hypothetical protein
MASPIKMNADAPKPGKLRGRTRSITKLGRKQLMAPAGMVKGVNKVERENLKSGKTSNQMKVSTSGIRADRKTNSPRKPSVAKVALKGAKNKMKAQGVKVNSAPTSRLSQGRRGK